MEDFKVNIKGVLRYPGQFAEWLEHNEDSDQQVLHITITNLESEFVGEAFFGYLSSSRGGCLSCLEIFIKEDFRRKRIATKVYDFAEKYYCDEVKPYPGHSVDAAKFWANRIKK